MDLSYKCVELSFITTRGYEKTNNMVIKTAFGKRSDLQPVLTHDPRRRHSNRPNMVDRNVLKSHVVSFNPCVSHYKRAEENTLHIWNIYPQTSQSSACLMILEKSIRFTNVLTQRIVLLLVLWKNMFRAFREWRVRDMWNIPATQSKPYKRIIGPNVWIL